MKVYLGAISPQVLRSARQAAPSHTFGATWTPAKMTPHDWPYILDNGVYGAWARGDGWSYHDWLNLVDDAQEMPRAPDFAVLPDAVGEAEKTYARSERWCEYVPEEWPTAFAAQDGMAVEEAVRFGRDLGCSTIFVGGTMEWKRRYADQFVMTAHDYGLDCHIARPGLPDGLLWAKRLGADSVDTTTIARGGSYYHLRTLEEQTGLPV